MGARAVVVGGTAWHVVAADVDPAWVRSAVAHDPIAAPLGARFLAALADQVGAEPGSLDVVLVAPPAPAAPGLELVPAEVDHPRVRRGPGHPSHVRVLGTPHRAGGLGLGRRVGGRGGGPWSTVPPCGSGRRPTGRACWSSAAGWPVGGRSAWRSTRPRAAVAWAPRW